jgi:cell division protein FtsX
LFETGGFGAQFVALGMPNRLSRVTPVAEDLVRPVRRTLQLLWGGALFVLLIATANITNLVLVRATGRAKELATRHALGAGRGRMARQLLTETLLLTLIGGLLGLATHDDRRRA